MKKFILFLTILFSHFCLVAETRTVYFYGPVSSSKDITTTKLTSDLFYSQLESLQGYSLIDNRNTIWNDDFSQINEDNSIIFYVEINENQENWECTITAIDSITKQRITKTEIFDGYYKILMEAKNSLIALLDEYASLTQNSSSPEAKIISNKEIIPSLDVLSGTWQGDNHISKIVILRGGRGFVIYKNGASMNIEVSIKDNVIFAKQTSRANASFFPDLPREIALVMASDAAPIEWTLSLIDNDTLSGEKITLMPKDNGAELTSVNVTWKRSF